MPVSWIAMAPQRFLRWTWILLISFLNNPAWGQEAGKVETAIYSFDPSADELVKEMFPREISISGVTHAFLKRGQPTRFQELDDVFEFHSWSMRKSEAGKDPRSWRWMDAPLESPWLATDRAPGWEEPLVKRAPRVAELAKGLHRPCRAFRSPLEKALFQRDVLQICMLYQKAIESLKSSTDRSFCENAKTELLSLFHQLGLSTPEAEALETLQSKLAIPEKFTSENALDLTRNYLPIRVLRNETGWYEMPFVAHSSLHFRAFGGRSFIRVFIKVPGWSPERFHRYWDEVANKFGANVTRDGRVQALPAGTETLLLRTFGIFLKDGSYADSGFPEEVLMRIFKHPETCLDLKTSDYRGSLFYRYRMQRRELLEGSSTFGLKRIEDDEPQFFGFLGETPDHDRAYSSVLTTMRSNCISCHSELHYGASTVFTLGNKRAIDMTDRLEKGLLQRLGPPNRFKLLTPEFLSLAP